MGFKVKRTIYRLRFADEAYDGLQVRVRALTLAQAFDVQDKINVRNFVLDSGDVTRWRGALEALADYVVDWNVTDDDGQPIPATADGFATMEPAMMFAVITAWISAMIGYKDPPEVPASGDDADPLDLEAEGLGLADASLSI